tara:strand:+ start:110 stop:655 length:546 start_codon:yes stop_codon:yes gene_type:complete
VEKFAIVLLSTIFIILITGSVQYVTADHVEEFGQGIFKDEHNMNSAFSKDSKYQIYLHVIIRNAQDQLVSVSQVTHGYYLPHQLTDQMIDKMQPGDNLSKEIVIIDKMKYEKIHLIDTYDEQTVDTEIGVDIRTKWTFTVDEYIDGHGLMRLPIFKVSVPVHPIAVDDVLTLHWTILRELN